MATEIQLGVPGYPAIVIADRQDAQTFVRILHKNGVSVNLREVEKEGQ